MDKVKVSKMTGKLKGLDAINTSPLDNDFCQAMAKNPDNICSKCYSIRMLNGFRKNCRPSWKGNGELLSSSGLTEKQLPNIKTELCRFSAHGEIINRTHALNLFEIARANPTVIFGFFTKRPLLVPTDETPENVVMIFSSTKVNEMADLPVGFDKVFSVFTEDFAQKNNITINCGAKSCDTCRRCYNKSNGITFVNEIIK